jgi:hypothetical protein
MNATPSVKPRSSGYSAYVGPVFVGSSLQYAGAASLSRLMSRALGNAARVETIEKRIRNARRTCFEHEGAMKHVDRLKSELARRRDRFHSVDVASLRRAMARKS